MFEGREREREREHRVATAQFFPGRDRKCGKKLSWQQQVKEWSS
jgi:hypothetical protein